MGLCKKDTTPLLTHWSYVFRALTHQHLMSVVHLKCIFLQPGQCNVNMMCYIKFCYNETRLCILGNGNEGHKRNVVQGQQEFLMLNRYCSQEYLQIHDDTNDQSFFLYKTLTNAMFQNVSLNMNISILTNSKQNTDIYFQYEIISTSDIMAFTKRWQVLPNA